MTQAFILGHTQIAGREMTLEIVFDERPQQTEDPAAQQSPMPDEGSYEEW